jgi:DNA-binding transcriptional MerR regulator
VTGPSPRAIDSVLQTLRRGQRQLARNPRAAVQAAVKQLLALGGPASAPRPGADDSRTYRIDELARVSGVTTRNIRAYQERGLLPPPQRVGRVALFDDTHLARLKIISSMLERGYTSANMLEMLTAWEHGRDLGQLLGLERALVPPAGDQGVTMSLPEARALAGGEADLQRVVDAGLVELSGTRARVLRPRLLEGFAEMRTHGMSTDALVDLYQQVDPAVARISEILVAAGAAQLGPRFLEGEGTNEDVSELVLLLTRFRTLALTSVTASLASAIEEQIESLLTDYLAATVLSEAEDAG